MEETIQLHQDHLYAQAREHRAEADWAFEIKYLLAECYPNEEKVILVMDNLNTNTPASLYKCFSAPEARSYAKRLEIHFTPVHGSWLNIAEIELNAMSRQCLARRIMDIGTVRKEVGAWEEIRNDESCTVAWHFTADDARNKLTSLYPKFTQEAE